MPSTPLTRSELAAQNDLFAAALRAKRRGQGSQAVRIFERLTHQYPTGPLAESDTVCEPPPAVLRGLADYVRAMGPDACPAKGYEGDFGP